MPGAGVQSHCPHVVRLDGAQQIFGFIRLADHVRRQNPAGMKIAVRLDTLHQQLVAEAGAAFLGGDVKHQRVRDVEIRHCLQQRLDVAFVVARRLRRRMPESAPADAREAIEKKSGPGCSLRSAKPVHVSLGEVREAIRL